MTRPHEVGVKRLTRAAPARERDEMIAALSGAKAGDIVLLHGCCHNPTGANLTAAQWDRVTELLRAHGLTHAMIDMGAARGLGSPAPDRPWRAGIADPRDPGRILDSIDLCDQALATSGVRATPTSGLAMGFARLHGGRTSLIMDASPPPEGQAVLACFADEQHAFPLFGVAFQTTQWRINPVILGARTPPAAIRHAVDEQKGEPVR